MKKHLLTLTLSSILAIPVVSHAEFKGGFADIGVHYLDWTSRTTEKSSTKSHKDDFGGNDSNLLIVFYVQIMPDDFVMQLHRF
ncbi:hypothetical protein CI732_15970 [Shigella boydii]|nr:hypothetical protein CI732_15970 [Shigella boydii]